MDLLGDDVSEVLDDGRHEVPVVERVITAVLLLPREKSKSNE